MAEFESKIYAVKIEPHPNADTIELAMVGDFKTIVRKDTLKDGDLIAYIPSAAIVPDWIIEKLGLAGRLAGSKHNRVKPMRLRGIVSEGLSLPLDKDILKYQDTKGKYHFKRCDVGQDVTKVLGITKWEPPIPTVLNGEVYNAFGTTLSYDIENFKKYPDILVEGEEVIMTEKIHGTFCQMGYNPSQLQGYPAIVASKGLGAKGMAFKFNENNDRNAYINALNNTDTGNGTVIDRLKSLLTERKFFEGDINTPVYLLGEVYGNVQDLKYGLSNGANSIRLFDIYIGEPGRGRYLDVDPLIEACHSLNIDMVPILYRGPFSKKIMLELSEGMEQVSGTEACIREGVVTVPTKERLDIAIGRVKLKSVSDAYLGRKGEVTEYA